MVATAENRPSLLIVDDVPENLAILAQLLREQYRTLAAVSGTDALEIARRRPPPDLILLDVMLPDLNGFEVCRYLKDDPATEDIPIIFLTAESDVEKEQTGLALGAVDYITKPFSPPLVLARVKTQLSLKASRDFLKDKNAFLESEVARRTEEIATIQDVTMIALGSLAETRDNETGVHIHRTQNLVRLLATKAARHPPFDKELPPQRIENLYKSAPLHDIGKVGIPDHILLKPGPLTAQEFEVMKTHTSLGALAIEAAERLLKTKATFLKNAREIAASHHEHWDGKGYPEGLKEEAIPLSGRIMALADVYDALRSERVYKPPFTHARALELMTKGSVGHFDPRLLQIFEDTASEWNRTFEDFSP